MASREMPQAARPTQAQTDKPDRPLQTRRPIGKPVLFGLLAILGGAVVWDLSTTAPFQEWRLSRMSLESLQKERDASNSHKPLLLYHIGKKLNDLGRFTEADGYLREAVGGEPESARYRDAWARALIGSGLTTAAFGQLSQYVGTHPNSAEAHLILGKFYVTQNSLNRAMEEFTTATQLDPRLGEAWSYLAVAHQGRNEPQQARTAAEKAVSLRPKDAGDHVLVAVLRSGDGDFTGARQAFEEALRLAPDLAVAHREYANFLLTHGGPDDAARAISLARRAVALDANDRTANLVLGRALAGGKPEELAESVTYLEKAARETPGDPLPALALAQAYRRMGRTADADRWVRVQAERQARIQEKERLTSRLELNGQDANAHRKLAHLMAMDGDIEGCLRHHAAAVRRAPDNPIALAEASDDLVSVGMAKEAMTLVERAEAVSVNNPSVIEARGNALLALGKPDEAQKEYHRVLEWYPDRYPRFRAKMDAYYAAEEANSPAGQAERAFQQSKAAMQGQVRVVRVPPEALESARAAVRLAPENGEYQRYLLRLLIQANQTDEGITVARQIAAKWPNDKATRTRLALLLVQRAKGPEELAEAKSELGKAAGDKESEPTWRYAKGLVALQEGDAQQAVLELREAARLDPRPAITFYKLAQAEAKAGHADAGAKAMAEYERRHKETEEEGQALFLLGSRPNDRAAYLRAAQVFEKYGRKADADAIRAAAPPESSASAASAATPQNREKVEKKGMP